MQDLAIRIALPAIQRQRGVFLDTLLSLIRGWRAVPITAAPCAPAAAVD